ncbi:hypothetical protein HaLaN_18378 [Haematococcus lacustris]|uniref:Uncharacterized protein n=1 Tax=Haematococcus lacustris TaxID=44745 RepID=A0A699ZQQ2_HAELA|nr:hypothetical protein HaLaN_18378 [Haematococcus lacustris]
MAAEHGAQTAFAGAAGRAAVGRLAQPTLWGVTVATPMGQAAVSPGSCADSGLQTFLQNKTNALLATCFPNATAFLRPLRALVTTGYEQAWDMLAQQYAAATGIQVQVQGLPPESLSSAIRQGLKTEACEPAIQPH